MVDSTNIKKILSILQEGTYSIPQIAEKVGLDENNVRVYVNRLKSRELVIENGKDGRIKLFCAKRAPIQEDSLKITQAGKRLYEIFAFHAREIAKILNPQERIAMNEIKEFLLNA